MPSTKYVVNEHFRAFQGEGVHAGRGAYFIRLHGCDQQCPWCDSAGTWHPQYKTAHPRFTGEELAAIVEKKTVDGTRPSFVVVTGGEPTLYNLDNLTGALRRAGFATHLETAGHRPITGDWNWVTLSPKPFAAHPLSESIAVADEFKLIVDSEESLQASAACIADYTIKPGATVWLHPEWSQRENPHVLRAICRSVEHSPLHVPCRAGWQIHKLYGVDQLDPDTDQRRIPLGGNSLSGSPR